MNNQKNWHEPDNQHPEGEAKHLPLWRKITPGQVFLTGGALAASGVADAAMHFDKTGVFFTLLASGVIAGMSDDILNHMVPGRDARRVIETTARVFKATPPTYKVYADQSAPAKMRRLLGRPYASDLEEAPGEDDLDNDPDETVIVDPKELDELEELQPRLVQRLSKNEPEQKMMLVTNYVGNDPRLVLHLAPNFLPDVNMILAEGIFACGVKGSGKTGVLAKIIEQIIQIAAQFDPAGIGIPLVVFDKEGDLASLLELLPNGRIADQMHWYTAEEIITQRLQVIVNLQAWLKPDQAGEIMATLANDLVTYTSSLDATQRIPCPVFLDEAQYWLPQESSVSYLSRETQRKLLDAFSILLNTGRKRGLTPFIFTQRIAQIDKSVISLGVQIFMRQVIDNDLKRCMEYVRSEIIGERKNLTQLSEGQGIVCLPKGVQLTVQFEKRRSSHISHSPTVDRILTQPARPLAQQNPMSYPTETDQIHIPSEAPRNLARTIETRKRSSTALPTILSEALNVYRPGMTYRDLAAELGYSNGEAREIWLELRRRGLLHTSAQAEPNNGRPALYPLPRQSEAIQETPSEKPKRRVFTASEIARGFALWEAGNTSVRKLLKAAKEANYGWSDGFCRDLQDELEEQGLIPKRERGAM